MFELFLILISILIISSFKIFSRAIHREYYGKPIGLYQNNILLILHTFQALYKGNISVILHTFQALYKDNILIIPHTFQALWSSCLLVITIKEQGVYGNLCIKFMHLRFTLLR